MKTKTTIELPEELFVAAKRLAAGRRTTLRALIERGLRAEMRGQPAGVKRPAIKWVTVDGGLPRGVDVADRASMVEALARKL